MAERLKELGANVTLTRDSDITLSPTERVKKVLAPYGSGSDVLVISNHLNAGGGDGAEVIYALRGTDELPNLILNKMEEQGQNIRKAYTRQLPTDPTKDYYFMLRNTGDTDAIIVEYGFLDSMKDDVTQLKNNWQDYAEATVEAIAEYLNLPYNQTTNNNVYTVIAGDTLWNIAKKFNTSVNEIKNLNNLTTNLLTIGQQITIPDNSDVYIVKAGDTLYAIAQKYGLSVDTLKQLNNLTNNNLSIGQELNIKNKAITYTVKPGDTLYSIANTYNTSIENIKKVNNLTSNLLSIGQQLMIS